MRLENFILREINGNFFEIVHLKIILRNLILKQKKEIVFISNYSNRIKDKCENEDIVAYYLNELAKKITSNLPYF